MDENEEVDVLGYLWGHGKMFPEWLDDGLSIKREKSKN